MRVDSLMKLSTSGMFSMHFHASQSVGAECFRCLFSQRLDVGRAVCELEESVHQRLV